MHRIRGHGPPIRLGATYLLWVGFVFIWLVSFWWWEFKFQGLQLQWMFGLYLFVVGYAIWLFLVSVILGMVTTRRRVQLTGAIAAFVV